MIHKDKLSILLVLIAGIAILIFSYYNTPTTNYNTMMGDSTYQAKGNFRAPNPIPDFKIPKNFNQIQIPRNPEYLLPVTALDENVTLLECTHGNCFYQVTFRFMPSGFEAKRAVLSVLNFRLQPQNVIFYDNNVHIDQDFDLNGATQVTTIVVARDPAEPQQFANLALPKYINTYSWPVKVCDPNDNCALTQPNQINYQIPPQN